MAGKMRLNRFEPVADRGLEAIGADQHIAAHALAIGKRDPRAAA